MRHENDLDFAIPVFRLGTLSDNEEDRNDRVGTYREIRAANSSNIAIGFPTKEIFIFSVSVIPFRKSPSGVIKLEPQTIQ